MIIIIIIMISGAIGAVERSSVVARHVRLRMDITTRYTQCFVQYLFIPMHLIGRGSRLTTTTCKPWSMISTTNCRIDVIINHNPARRRKNTHRRPGRCFMGLGRR